MATDPELKAHLEWLGYLQPVGLVASPLALLAAQAHVNRNIAPQQAILLDLVREERLRVSEDGHREARRAIPDFPDFCFRFFGWEARDLAGAPGGPELPDSLTISLPEYGEALSPTYAVPDPDQPGSWLMLIQELRAGTDPDATPKQEDRHWHASPQLRFERLLRETKIPTGILFNGTHIRLAYAPAEESTGHLTFLVQAMCEVAGRPIVAALHMLLCAERLFTVPTNQRLPAILQQSRKYQNEVSVRLAEQVLAALYELLGGFQAAHEASGGALLKEALEKDPSHIYGGLLASLLRMVFVLYAEDRGLMPTDAVYVNSYSVAGLFERLREDAARYPDTMDQRYGAWSQLLTLFRLIHDGAAHGAMRLPARHGKLFDPDAYPFLEGRGFGFRRQDGVPLKTPRVSDGVIYRILENLLLLDGERLSYRALDVEQIGSVYEAMMGFELRVANGPSIAVRPENVVVNLQELLAAEPEKRAKLLKEEAACEISGKAHDQLKNAKTVEELVAALDKKVSKFTPNVLPAAVLFLQPTDERRRSGSHYTPRSLTEPIVRTTFRPIFERLGPKPRSGQLLDLKVCDPAMGSGAFLVEACRFLGDKLVEAWQVHGEMPTIPLDEDPQLYARRVVAQRCLYGVDKNSFAVDLAKLSLWLATLAKDHPFTFLDHALRCGDSLVGLTRQQIAQFHWDTSRHHDRVFGQEQLEKTIERVTAQRKEILQMAEDNEASILLKQQKLDVADQALTPVRRAGDLEVAAFFQGKKDKEREQFRKAYLEVYLHASKGQATDLEKETQFVDGLRSGRFAIPAFHWEIEFPEVFGRENPGFDAIISNPPFAGKNTLLNSHREGYLDWLQELHEESHGSADLVAHFFRRTFRLLCKGGCFGLIATNTIAQGDTRTTGLRWICTRGGTIYAARKHYKWPGRAAVTVSIVHVIKGSTGGPFELDGGPVPIISAYLFHDGGHENPALLLANAGKSFQGCIVLGMGFTFDDTDSKGIASPIAEMERLIAKDPRNGERVFPYIGGEEVNDSPGHAHHRYVISFGEMSEEEARQWPDLMAILERRAKPERMAQNDKGAREKWWQFIRPRGELWSAIRGLNRVLVIPLTSKDLSIVLLPTRSVFAHSLGVFAYDSHAVFCVLQSRVHEIWTRFFGSSLEDRLRYTPSDCFETFPMPSGFEASVSLENCGRKYYEFRAALMVKNNEGLTITYNRFHDPEETNPDILRLRELHAAMDRVVLDAYGWTDIQPTCEFILDYEEEEDEENGPGRRKKPWRHRWPDEIRDEVLARLLELNRQRAEEEQISGLAAEGRAARSKHRKGKAAETGQMVEGFLKEKQF